MNQTPSIQIGETVTLHERGRQILGICIADGGDGKQFWFSVLGTNRKVLAVAVTDDGWTVLQGDSHAR